MNRVDGGRALPSPLAGRPRLLAVRLGVSRGWIEVRQSLANPPELWFYVFPVLAMLGVTFFMRHSTVPGTDFSLGARTVPSMLGLGIVFGGMVNVGQQLILEREDGTLLRAKAIPHGMTGYLVGKTVAISMLTAVGVVLQLIPGLLLVDGIDTHGLAGVATLAWILPLGLAASMPIGAVLGSLFSDPRSMGLLTLPLFGLVGISGIFYPITSVPGWLQAVAQVFPLYWIGLGMRSALLPGELAGTELGDSWRHTQTLGVLCLWAVAGLLVAPAVLRRMARRESGASVAARQEKALQRVR